MWSCNPFAQWLRSNAQFSPIGKNVIWNRCSLIRGSEWPGNFAFLLYAVNSKPFIGFLHDWRGGVCKHSPLYGVRRAIHVWEESKRWTTFCHFQQAWFTTMPFSSFLKWTATTANELLVIASGNRELDDQKALKTFIFDFCAASCCFYQSTLHHI